MIMRQQLSSSITVSLLPRKRPIPVKFSAPEVVKEARYSSASDVWSFGIVMWETCSPGQVPYKEMSNTEFVERVVEGSERLSRPELASEDMFQIMLSTWTLDSDKRPTFRDLHSTLSVPVSAQSSRINSADGSGSVVGESRPEMYFTGLPGEEDDGYQ